MIYKVCTKCGKEFEATTEFFYARKDSKDGLRADCKKCFLKKCKKYNNSEVGKNKCKQWKNNNGEKIKIYRKQYHEDNREYRNEYSRKYFKTVDGRNAIKKYRQSFKGKLSKGGVDKKYREKNKISVNLSSRMWKSLKGNKSNLHWETLVDYTLPELKLHLEKQFKDNMSWNNYGEWHIDHKKPIALFNIIDYDCDDFKECWALNNLQPLWASENCSKGAKYMEETG